MTSYLVITMNLGPEKTIHRRTNSQKSTKENVEAGDKMFQLQQRDTILTVKFLNLTGTGESLIQGENNFPWWPRKLTQSFWRIRSREKAYTL